MPGLQERFCRNEQQVIAKVMDGEAIVINLDNGMYYSLDQAGAAIWTMLEAGCSRDDIVQWITAAYEVAPSQAEPDVQRLTSELLAEHLLLRRSEAQPSSPPEPLPTQRLTYESPRLNIYRDMGDLLALDPPMPVLRDVPWKDPEGNGGR